jgi:predicted Rossmann fold flavoprotein
MQVYDIAVVGAGPAGIMSCIRAAQLNQPEGSGLASTSQSHKPEGSGAASDSRSHKNVILLERNNCIGKKILLSGKGRCNITNIVALDEFIARFGRQGEFLRCAFSKFFNQDLIDFFKEKGLRLKIERQGRVFPDTDRAASVIEALKKCLLESNTKIVYNKRVAGIEREGGLFKLFLEDGRQLSAKQVILATGGRSFSFTGSAGDGFTIAGKLGHSIVPLMPGMVPLRTEETWVKELKGLTLKNIRLTFKAKNKKIVSNVGELLFTHFGVSGPLVLDLSGSVLRLLAPRGGLLENKEVVLEIDLKPGLSPQQLEERLLREFGIAGRKSVKNVLKELLPHKLAGVFVNLLGIDYNKMANQVTKEERRSILDMLKSLRLRITGSLPLEEAMVTCGGVSTKEINPRTMESRLVPGLYFAGEIIDGSAPSGGYNLQQAFSTGYLAGEEAARVKNA